METNKLSGSLVKFVTFKVKGEQYCLKITSVKEVLEVPEITEVPNSASFVKGIINVRGVIITVIDGSQFIVGQPCEHSHLTRILIFEDEKSGYNVGILVDSVSEVLIVDTDEVTPFVKKGGNYDHYVRGLFHKKDAVYVILNESKLFENSKI